jgi:Beta-lactamase enzyme family/ORF 12 gene product N-terminal
VSAVTLPHTPAGDQARWLIAAAARLPIPETEIRAHFDESFLSQVSPATLNTALAQAGVSLAGSGTVRLAAVAVDRPRLLVATAARGEDPPALTVTLGVDAEGLISGLTLKPLLPATPTTWTAVDAAVCSVAPDVHLLVADTTGGACRPIHAIDPATPAPLGSMFKLYVLDALGRAVAAGRVSWDQPLTITAARKSLPSGVLRDLPDGACVSVRETAAKMISISDNTAADMLIGLLGRSAVEAAVTATGMAQPRRDRPFLTTREFFTLKLDRWPTLARRYAAADEAGRRALLADVVDRLPLPALDGARGWTAPREIGGVEWFASAEDVCRAYMSLAALARRPGLGPLGDVLEINDGGLGLDRTEWRTTWFKGGGEPGVMTLGYLATARDGRRYFVGVLAQDRSAPIEPSAAATLLSAIKGAFTLAAAEDPR